MLLMKVVVFFGTVSIRFRAMLCAAATAVSNEESQSLIGKNKRSLFLSVLLFCLADKVTSRSDLSRGHLKSEVDPGNRTKR